MEKLSLLNQTTHSGAEIPDNVTWYYAFTWDGDQDIPRYQKIIMECVDFFSKKKLPEKPNHVFAFCEVGDGLLFLEPTTRQIITSYKYDPDGGKFTAELAISVMTKGQCVILPSSHEPNIRSWRSMFNWMPTCVSAVKIFTGLPVLAITPNTLYNSIVEQYLKTEKVRDGI